MAAAQALTEDLKAYPPKAGVSTVNNSSHYDLIPLNREQWEPTQQVRITFGMGSIEQDTGRPNLVQFAALRDPKLRVIQSIPLQVSVEDGNVLVCWSETNEFGTGMTLSEALDDFANGLRDLHHQLFAPEVKLSVDLQNVKKSIERHIQPR